MLAVVKTHRTDIRTSGFIPAPVLRVLRHEYGRKLSVKPGTEGDDALESVFDSEEYKAFSRPDKSQSVGRTRRFRNPISLPRW